MVNKVASFLTGQLGLLCKGSFFRLNNGNVFMKGEFLSYPVGETGEILFLEPFPIPHETMVESIYPEDLGIDPKRIKWRASRASP